MISRLSRILVVAAILAAYSMASAIDVKPGCFLFMLGSKTANPEVKSNHNLDVFLGFAGLQLSAKTDNFEGFTEVFVFPAGYGFSYVQSAFLDSASNLIVTKSAEESKVIVNNAWAKFTKNNFQVMIGRASLKYSKGFFFGDYLQRGAGPIIDYGGTSQNCLQLQNTYKAFTTSILLGVNDINLDRGYLTVREVIKPVDKFQMSFGYESNVFDPIRNKDAEVLSNLCLTAQFDYVAGQYIFGEFGMRGLGAESDDAKRFPFMLGVTIPTKNVLSNLSVEIEYDGKRADVENLSSFEYGLIVSKKFGDHFTSILSMNNGVAKNAGVFAGNFEMVVSF